MIILIATVSVLVAFFATNALMGSSNEEAVSVDTIEAISGSVTDPDPAIFNSNSINPAVEVQITPGDQ